jgi:cytochrome c biogenesis protein CcdA/glutaredoxin
MNIRILVLLFFFVFWFFPNSVFAQDQITLFYGEGCIHCALVDEYIEENNIERVVMKEVYQNKENAEEFTTLADKLGIPINELGVPFLYTGREYFVGDIDIIEYFKKGGEVLSKEKLEEDVIIGEKSLPIMMVVGAALVDAINPCAFAVLLLLMMTILSSGDKKKALWSGLSFSLSIFISYLLMGVGIYSALASVGTTHIFMKIVAIIAIILGILNLKDYFWYGKGFLMEVPVSWRPKMKKFISSITNPMGAFLVGFIVSLFLLPCTSGPYFVIIGMLGHAEEYTKAFLLLVLYNIIFVLPMILITFGTYLGMNINKAEEERKKNLRILHLVAGIVMVLMGIFLLVYFV